MKFDGQYLLYNEYLTMGGTISGEMPFNLLQNNAKQLINKYTFNRIENLTEIPLEVKICVFELINVLKSYSSTLEKDKSISSESIDGYSVTYNSNISDSIKSKDVEIKNIIENQLSNIKLEDGTPLLYRGF